MVLKESTCFKQVDFFFLTTKQNKSSDYLYTFLNSSAIIKNQASVTIKNGKEIDFERQFVGRFYG